MTVETTPGPPAAPGGEAAPAAGARAAGSRPRRDWDGPLRPFRPLPYTLAVLASGFATLTSWLLGALAEPSGFPLFLAAVMFSAWYGGLGPGLLSTTLGALAGTYFFLPPPAALLPLSLSDGVRLGVFLVEALVITSLSTALRTAQQRAEALFAGEQAARVEIEAAAQRIRDLQRVTETALSHLDLDDLLRELLGRIREVLGADTVVFLLTTEGGQELLVRAAHGLEQEVAEGIKVPLGRGIAGRIAARRRPMIFEELPSAEVWSPILREKGLRSLLGIPLMVDGRVIGVVHVGSLRSRRFTGDEIRLLGLVADRIAIAIDHARLYEAERSARAAAETAERRFRLLVDGVRDYALYLLDREGRVVSWNAGAERMKGYRADEVVGRHFGLFYTPEDTRRSLPAQALAAAEAEGRFETERWRVRKDGSRFWAGVVITALRDDAGGLVGFATLTHDLTERKRAAEIRARLLEQVIAAQEEEQRRIARELHDETGQSLTSLLVGLRAVEEAPTLEGARARAAELRRITVRALDEVRRFAWGLRPASLDELGLVPALEQYAAECAQSYGMSVDVQARGLESGRLPAPVETALYRIVQEALTNAAKHAKAQTVSVVVQRHASRVQAIVADDGCGFDVDAALGTPSAWAHLGLHGMRERAALLDGSVTIESTPGEGTTVYAWVPLAGEDDGEDPDPHRG
jgi:PAS domain S-box-containing protein